MHNPCENKNIHRFCEILNAAQKAQFIEKSMVDGNVDTAFGDRTKKTIKSKILHKGSELGWHGPTIRVGRYTWSLGDSNP